MHINKITSLGALLANANARLAVVGVMLVAVPGVPALAAEPTASAVENSVVKVFSTIRPPDLGKPWAKQTAREGSATGIVVEGNRILTNAHVVLYASQIQIQGTRAGDKIAATVEAIAPGIDLALLKLADESFFGSHPALPRAKVLPQIKDAVLVYGFPTGGTSLSITKGIVSRIEYAPYNFPVSGLRAQIDAPLNPGNSGGPVVVADKVIGLAFGGLSSAQNIGYLIPSEEIDLFLEDVADGRYDGKAALFDSWQPIENPALRAFLKLPAGVQGVVVTETAATDDAYPLKPFDVITKIGDTALDNQGTIQQGGGLRVRFTYLVQKLAKNGKLPLTVVRNGKALSLLVPVSASYPKLIPFLQGAYPSFFVYGPLVFTNASEELVAAMTGGTTGQATSFLLSEGGNPLVTRRGDKPAFDKEELVVVPAPFFPHPLATGYGNPVGKVIKAVNGIPVKNLLHLVEILRDSSSEFTVIEFAGRGGRSVVFPHREAVSAVNDILRDAGIRSEGSPDALAVWNGKPPR